MEKIGEFSKRCEVTIKTLRYYDKLGLLVPDYIDNFTGYRYYGAEKVAEMHRITELKNIGFSLEEIKWFCSAENGDKKWQIIGEKRQDLEKLISETARKLRELKELEQKLNSSVTNMKEERKMKNNFNMPFVNDEAVIGRWEIIASVNKREEFVPSQENYKNESSFEEIYFLPDGNEYWGFSWTKDYIKISFGDGLLCPYELEEIGVEKYMFAGYHTDNRNEIWVLKQADNKRYTKYEIAQHDNIDMPFINDQNIIGKWSSVDFVRDIDAFNPMQRFRQGNLFLETVQFLPDGNAKKFFNREKEKSWNVKWTKGTLLEKNGDCTIAPAYEIRNYDGTDYLFLEWKSGDYIWGRRKPSYYVLKHD